MLHTLMLAVSRVPEPKKARRVVLVDDDPASLRALQRALHGEPCEILATDDPGQVLSWVDDKDVALVISDQRMPAMPGHELLTRVRERSAATACVLLTAWPDAPEADWLRGRGVRSVLAKPWNVDELRRLVRSCL